MLDVIRSYLSKMILSLGIVFCLGIGFTLDAKANRSVDLDPVQCIPVDLVFIIDQSPDLISIDPQELQNRAIKWMVNFLGYDRLLSCPETIHRVGIIRIGNEQDKGDLHKIDPDTAEEWKAMFPELTNSLDAVPQTTTRTLSGVLKALSKAIESLTKAQNTGVEERKQAIVLMLGRDGAVCRNFDRINPCAHYEIDNNQKILQEKLNSLLQEKISLSVISFGDGSYGRIYGFEGWWDRIVKEYGGQFFHEVTPNIVTADHLMKVFLSLSPREDVKAVCNTADVDPMLNSVGFNILSAEPISGVVFEPSPPILMNMTPGKNTLFYYLYKKPEAGNWRFELDCDNNKALVYMQLVRAKTFKIIEPSGILPQYQDDSNNYNPDNPYYLEFYPVDAQNDPLPDSPDFPSDGHGTVTFPDKIGKQDLTFKYENGRYISNEPLTTSQVGDYTVQLVLNIPRVDALQNDNYKITKDFVYKVEPRIAFDIQLDSAPSKLPVHGGLLSKYFLKVKPIDVSIKLVANKDTGVDFSGIFTIPDKALKATLVLPDKTSVKEVWLMPNPSKKDEYTGQIGMDVNIPGDYSLGITLDGDYDTGKWIFIHPRDTGVDFMRKDGVMDSPTFYYTILLIFFLFAATMVGSTIWNMTGTASGYLLFYPPGPDMKPFHSIDLSVKKRRHIFITAAEIREMHPFLSNLGTISAGSPNFWRDPFAALRSRLLEIDVSQKNNSKVLSKSVDKTNSTEVELGDTDDFIKVTYSA